MIESDERRATQKLRKIKHAGQRTEYFLCTPLDGNYPLELHFANYSLGMLTDSHGLGTPNYGGYSHGFCALSSGSSANRLVTSNFGGYGHGFGALSAGGSQRLHPKEAQALCTATRALLAKKAEKSQ